MKTRPSLTAWEQKEKNSTSDWMSMKLTAFWLRTFKVALIAFSSLSAGSHAVNKDVSISIPKTIIFVAWQSLESFCCRPNRSVSQM